MPRARVVKEVHKKPVPEVLKGLMRNKLMVTGLVLIIAGILLLEVSLHYTEELRIPNVTTIHMDVTTNGSNTAEFNQPKNVTEKVSFSLPSTDIAHYRLYKYISYVSPITHLKVVKYDIISSGNVTNNTAIHISPVNTIIGQTYAINMTAMSSSHFPAQVQVSYNITTVEHSAKSIGIPGGLVLLSGIVIAAVSITKAFDERKLQDVQ